MSTPSILQFRLELGASARNARTADASFNPPGYTNRHEVAQHQSDAVDQSEQQEHLARKRVWEVAMAPAKSLPMNMFMMYMAGRTVSIFPMMMVAMMLWRPIKALATVNTVFKPFQDDKMGSLLLQKLVFILGNLGAVALALYKVHTMGLLPTHPSDWLEFVDSPERMQYTLASETYV